MPRATVKLTAHERSPPGASISLEVLASQNGRLTRVASQRAPFECFYVPASTLHCHLQRILACEDRNERADYPSAGLLLLIMCPARKINIFDRRMVGLELAKLDNQ